MEKKKQMIEYMVQDLVEMLSEVQGVEYDIAMRMIYDSQVYEKLIDEEKAKKEKFEKMLEEVNASIEKIK